MKSIEQLISTIKVDNANLDYIKSTGKVNGSLYLEIKRVMTEYNQQQEVRIKELVSHKENLLNEISKIKPAVLENVSKKA